MSVTPLEPGKKRRGRPPGTGKGTEIARAERNREICRLYAEEGMSKSAIGRKVGLDHSAVSRIINEHMSSIFPEADRRAMALTELARYERLLETWLPKALFRATVPYVTKEGDSFDVPIGVEDAAKAAKVTLDVMARIDKRFGLEEYERESNIDDLDAAALNAELNALVQGVADKERES